MTTIIDGLISEQSELLLSEFFFLATILGVERQVAKIQFNAIFES